MRFLLYTAAVILLFLLLPRLVRHGGIEVFRENGLIEWLQVVILVMSAAVFFLGAWIPDRPRELMVCLACLALLAVMRELDSFLDAWGPLFSRKGAGLVLIVVSAIYLLPRFRALAAQFRLFWHTTAFGLLWAGAVQALVFAQLLGHKSFLQALMGDAYTRDYKRAIEESGELCGYSLLLFGAIEAILRIHKASAESRPSDGAGRAAGTDNTAHTSRGAKK